MLISRKWCKIEIWGTYNGRLIGNRIWPIKWQQRQRPWMTLKVIHRLQAFSNAIRRTFVQHCTRFQLTVLARSLWVISWASCNNKWAIYTRKEKNVCDLYDSRYSHWLSCKNWGHALMPAVLLPLGMGSCYRNETLRLTGERWFIYRQQQLSCRLVIVWKATQYSNYTVTQHIWHQQKNDYIGIAVIIYNICLLQML